MKTRTLGNERKVLSRGASIGRVGLVSKISEGTLIFFGGSSSTLFRSAPTQHDMPCPMCAGALVANILGASAVGTAGGVAALKMKDKARKVKSSKPKPKPKAK